MSAADPIAAARDLLRRALVLAPEGGTIADLRFFTQGASIVAGQPVLDIGPMDDALLVAAAILPKDIARLPQGQPVNVRLTGFSHRRVPPIPGTLIHVGADRQINARGDTFFLVRAVLDSEATRLLPSGVSLTPGMPADVLVLGTPRSTTC